MDINFRLRLIREKQGLSQAKFANIFNLPQSTYAQYEKGGRSIPDELKMQLSERFNVNIHWLVTGTGDMFLNDSTLCKSAQGYEPEEPSTSGKFSRGSSSQSEDVEFIPMTDLKVSAGSGEEWNSGELTGEVLAVPKKIYNRYKHLCEAFGGATVRGDSMEPTLKDGEPVVFAKGYIESDGIYVIAIHNELKVKRLCLDMLDNKVTIISDNKNYPSKEYPLDKEGLSILGKVIFWIHTEG